VTLLLLITSLGYGAYHNAIRSNMVVYSVSKGYIIDFMHGNRVFSLKSDNIDETSLRYTTSSYRRYRGIVHVSYIDPFSGRQEQDFLLCNENVFKAGSKWIYLIQGSDERNWGKADIVILTRFVKMQDVLKVKSYPKTIVMLNEVKQDVRKYFNNIARKNFNVVDIIEIGGYQMDI
jgi:hypothetical protein